MLDYDGIEVSVQSTTTGKRYHEHELPSNGSAERQHVCYFEPVAGDQFKIVVWVQKYFDFRDAAMLQLEVQIDGDWYFCSPQYVLKDVQDQAKTEFRLQVKDQHLATTLGFAQSRLIGYWMIMDFSPATKAIPAWFTPVKRLDLAPSRPKLARIMSFRSGTDRKHLDRQWILDGPFESSSHDSLPVNNNDGPLHSQGTHAHCQLSVDWKLSDTLSGVDAQDGQDRRPYHAGPCTPPIAADDAALVGTESDTPRRKRRSSCPLPEDHQMHRRTKRRKRGY
ncbi:hypothetical protein HDK77DRAFT_431363 [Phyllosticta capitalensis]